MGGSRGGRAAIPSCLVLLLGMILGVMFTTTLTFHLQWCAAGLTSRDQDRRLRWSPGSFTQRLSATQRCVCGDELVALEKKASADRKHSLLAGNPSAAANGWPSEPPVLVVDGGRRPNRTDKPVASSLHNDGRGAMKMGLLVSVVSKQGQPQWVESVYDTWGRDANQVLMFVGDNFNLSDPSARGLPLVKLPGLQQVGGVNILVPVLRYLSQHYLSTHYWFMVAVDNSYVRVDKLQQLLSQLNPMEVLYLGRAASGRIEEAEKLGLKPHERYCLGTSGIVLSSALLAEMSGHLEHCLQEGAGVPEDVALGKCISAVLGVQCTQTDKTRLYFFEDYSGKPVTEEYMMQKVEIFSALVAYHPVPSLSAMRALHRHYKQVQFSSLVDRLRAVQSQIGDVCDPGATPTSVPDGECPPSLCSCERGGADAASSLPSPYQPTSIYDYQPWTYFDSVTAFPDRDVYPSYKLKTKKNLRQELKEMLAKAVQKMSQRHGRALKFKKLVNGWVRHNPFLGSEYIVDCLLLDGGRKYLSKRISLVRPLAADYVVRKDGGDQAAYVNMVVPLTRVNRRFEEFMKMYEQLALVSAERRVRLVLSVYGKEDVEFVSEVVAKYRAQYSHADIDIVEGRGEFSRGKALHGGMSRLAPDELAFVCDVDMRVEAAFLERCRKNAVPGKRVYYPEFFKLYNMNYVYWNRPHPRTLSLKRSHGHWAYYSFGMLCIYKSDYSAAGGMDTHVQGWGDEDVQFFNKVVRRRLQVLRAPDKALSHRWHEKHCPRELSKEQHRHCLSSQQENLADRKELASYVQQRGVEIKGSVTGAADLASNATADDEQDYDYGG